MNCSAASRGAVHSEVRCVFANEYCEKYEGKQAATLLQTNAMKESIFLDPKRE